LPDVYNFLSGLGFNSILSHMLPVMQQLSQKRRRAGEKKKKSCTQKGREANN